MKKENLKIVYLKYPHNDITEQTFVRMISDKIKGGFVESEMLIAGVISGLIPAGVYKLKYREQRLLSESEYRRIWHAILRDMVEITESEFEAGFMEMASHILNISKPDQSKEESKSEPKFKQKPEYGASAIMQSAIMQNACYGFNY